LKKNNFLKMKSQLIPSLKLTFFSIAIFATAYPLLFWGIAQLAPARGKVEFLEKNGQKIGAARIGQKFDQPGFFWSRPSAVGYNAAGSGGSNKGPSNPDYLKDVEQRIADFAAAHPYLDRSEIPSEMVTASGSGLDPDISPQAARIQVRRVAAARKLDEAKLAQFVENQVEKPLFGFLGVPKVNVLRLNLALEKLDSVRF
jgi:potassium-transporting ATPase KdpC subunit